MKEFKRICRFEAAVGEDRAAIYENEKLVELHVRRWSDKARPRAGDIRTARVRSIDVKLGAAFVDVGAGEDGFLRFTSNPNMPRLSDGALCDVKVLREAEPGKGPIVAWSAKPTLEQPGSVRQQGLRDYLGERFEDLEFEDGQVATALDVYQPELSVKGGGSITIELTKALTAIDVDKGNAVSGLAVSEAAAPMIARELRLRGLGGLICVDYPNMRQPRQRDALMKAVAKSLEMDPDNPKLATLSRFGLVEMTRTRPERSIDQLVAETPTESAAMDALRLLSREAKVNGGAKLTLSVPYHVKAWLDGDNVGWRAAMAERIGERFTVEAGESLHVSADR